MRAVYLDCFSGVSGNMLLGAFLAAGVPERRLREELAKLKVTGYEVLVSSVEKCGIQAVYVDVLVSGRQHHRHLPDIFHILDESPLSENVRARCKAVFGRLAEAEAKVHGTTVEKIHFHEVGAVDAIVDVVGTVFCLEYLGIEAIYVSRLQTGTGFVKCSHGWMPIPAPATAELLRGIPYYNGEISKELVTPTGAALLSVLASAYGERPAGFVSNTTGYGAGTWDLDIPNVLRLQLGDVAIGADNREDARLWVMEANIDDLNPQIYQYVMDTLLAAGALDVWLTPIIMKKSRPAITLSVLLDACRREAITALLFAETTTIGVRTYPVERTVAAREIITVKTAWGEARVKISSIHGQVCTVSPEYEDCRVLASANKVPLKVVQQAVLQAAQKYSNP